MVVIGLLCSTCWFIFGIYERLIPTMIPNGLGIIFSLFQIVCWAIFYTKSKTSKAAPTLEQFIKSEDDEI
jgi:hypothetical protein